MEGAKSGQRGIAGTSKTTKDEERASAFHGGNSLLAHKVFHIFARPFTFRSNILNNKQYKQVKGNFILSLFGLFRMFI